MVPTLRTDDGELLTENAAILQYVAERFPDATSRRRAASSAPRLQQWLCFIGTELHKALFIPLLDKKAPAEAKAYVLANADSRLGVLDKHLAGPRIPARPFSIADAYLCTVLNWSRAP